MTTAPEHLPPPGYQTTSAVHPFAVEFDITVVDGDEGDRLAVAQAEAILDVVTWLCAYSADGRGAPDGRTAGNILGRAPPT